LLLSRRTARVLLGVLTLLAAPLLGVGGRAGAASYPLNAHYTVGPVLPGCAQGRASTIAIPDAFAAGGKRKVWVYRPAVPDDRSLPVLYVLHGLPGTSDDLYRSGVAAALERAVCAGASPFVVVAPDGATPGVADNEWADDAQGRFKLESWLTGRLIGAVEGSRHRPAGDRALAGFSMGGFAATSIALRHPGLYGSVAALSGYFHIDDPDGVFHGVEAAHDPTALAGRARGLRVYLGDGDIQSDPVTDGETPRYGNLLHSERTRLEVVMVHGTHSLATVRTLVPSLVRFLDAGWA